MAAARHGARLVHGTCVAVGGCGVIILGPPGSGKSDLALRLIDQPGRATGAEPIAARLVADDQVLITRHQDRLFAAAPTALSGLMEVRGLGVVAADSAGEAELKLAIRLTDAPAIERLPDLSRSKWSLLGLRLPEIAIDPGSASAAARVRAGVLHVLRRTPEPAT